MQHTSHTRYSYGLIGWAAAAVMGLAACNSKPITENVPPPQIADLVATTAMGDGPENMLDWAGTYQAVLPCNGCPGTAISVQLRPDRTAIVRERGLGTHAGQSARTYSGAFRFDPPGGSLITLSKHAQESPAYRFFVAERWIELRDRSTGAALSQSAAYRLRKTSELAP